MDCARIYNEPKNFHPAVIFFFLSLREGEKEKKGILRNQ